MKSKSFIPFLFFTIFFSSCNSQNDRVKNISPAEFDKGISQMGAQLIDVRSPEEYEEKHIARSKNININDGGFYKQMEGMVEKSKPVYFYCLSGARSKKAAEWALKNGFQEAYNLDGGITAWIGAGKSVTNVTGTPVPSGMTFDEYLNAINKDNKLVLVDFYAVWCGPCKILKPIVQKVVKKNANHVELLEIDADKNSIVAAQMNIRSIPLLLLYKEGKEVWRNLGVIEEHILSEKVKEFSKK